MLGGIGVGALIYGLLQISAVSEFMSPITEPVSDFFSSEDDDDFTSSSSDDIGSEITSGYDSTSGSGSHGL